MQAAAQLQQVERKVRKLREQFSATIVSDKKYLNFEDIDKMFEGQPEDSI